MMSIQLLAKSFESTVVVKPKPGPSRGAEPSRRGHVWGLDIARSLSDAGGVGALLEIADVSSGKTFLPCYDGNGNIVALVNGSTGATAAVYEYSPFGEPLRAETLDAVVADQPFRFSTHFTDTETGLGAKPKGSCVNS